MDERIRELERRVAAGEWEVEEKLTQLTSSLPKCDGDNHKGPWTAVRPEPPKRPPGWVGPLEWAWQPEFAKDERCLECGAQRPRIRIFVNFDTPIPKTWIREMTP